LKGSLKPLTNSETKSKGGDTLFLLNTEKRDCDLCKQKQLTNNNKEKST
jgi:hypothetical protein